ncbi:MAG: helix-turn-helix domain-containing protein [Intestinibacter bartlettii]|uniref:HTH cro/C1-type domain-containing protein n=1 Tax=human gut metagenome TaxID=408170 RepID=W1WHG9_9ZZZZ|nr:helix-turn-helix transcriptional regulator [Intestinibacter bartlettii]MDU1254374.1 helix-turn-helix transcriptional regulator [Peptostreptococcaceae bacterium]MDU2693935.1 helix-turn-helix transcriptional regulator [Intestinibacter bartlettii]MDU6210059.1 helix-turn-helix transcriptional regulator [Clostridium perfringens]
MEVGKQIKNFRQDLKLSQEELASKIFVTRQTISNLENGKNYPDVNSLIMLSQLFTTSLDILVKGDVIEMKKQVSQDDVRRFKLDTIIFTVLIILTVISVVPLFLYLKLAGIVLWLLIARVMIYYVMQLNKQKRNNDIQTYRETLAFIEDKEIE